MDSNSLTYSIVAHMILTYKYTVPTIKHISVSFFLRKAHMTKQLAKRRLLWDRVLYGSEFTDMTSSKHQPIRHMPNASHSQRQHFSPLFCNIKNLLIILYFTDYK